MGERSRNSGIADWALRLVPAAILILAIPGKFAADPAAVAMFTELGAEPFGRWATGFFEVVAVLLLLLPATSVFGGLLAAGLMSGALLAHLTVLGVAPGGDPTLFVMALASFVAALALVWRRRRQIPVLGQLGRSGEAPAR
jgi:MYXO-CTERM domain-containing protein